MSKDTRVLFYTLLAAALVIFVTLVVVHNDLVDEIRVGDGHVNSFVDGQHSEMQAK